MREINPCLVGGDFILSHLSLFTFPTSHDRFAQSRSTGEPQDNKRSGRAGK